MSGDGPHVVCRRFLRDLADHVAAFRAGTVPAHAEACPACRDRLQRAVGLAGALASAPVIPSALRRPDLLSELYERIVADYEASGVAEAIRRVDPAPASAADPVSPPSLDEALEVQDLLTAPVAAPPALWARVRDRVHHEVAHRRSLPLRRLVRFCLLGAAAAGIAGVTIHLVREAPVAEPPRVVFLDMKDLPMAFSPTAVLRLAGK